ncbi:hypothetical protein ALI22I_30540 [Saccharothrix sp. ALI-22-I]|uniref:hypothetical protein n=1 Tax=Saccharothrix sp. ALI-22-I TaxID=1933778 RepID=UPI00097CA957|nr:hypothetical protein [Saccharothrix sp. ALI-22-I]ONI84826.1 hypothetical protein ALI22I_30540 [Saccharothrix sp. ALI-22-I]
MTDGRRFDPPGNMTDFDHIADQRAQWNTTVSGWFDEIIQYHEQHLLIGQNGQPGEHRARSAAVVRADGTTVPLSAPPTHRRRLLLRAVHHRAAHRAGRGRVLAEQREQRVTANTANTERGPS